MSKTKEELKLEKLVFGDIDGFETALAAGDASDSDVHLSDDQSSDAEIPGGDDLFYVEDKVEDSSNDEEDSGSEPESEDSSEDDEGIWADSDDDKLEISLTKSNRLRKLRVTQVEDTVSGRDYERRLRAQFEKMHPRPKWAKVVPNAEEDVDADALDSNAAQMSTDPLQDLLSRKTSYVSSQKPRLLPTEDIDIQRLTDVTRQRPVPAAVQALDFHPTHPLLLEAGYDSTLRVFQVDGKYNQLATSLHIKNSPFQTALFHKDGARVFAGGRRRYLYIWDLETGALDKVSRMYGHEQSQRSMEKFILSCDGKYLALIGSGGWLNILSAATGQWVAGAKIDDGMIADVVWHKPQEVTITTTAGDVYIWDIVARQFIDRWKDVGAVGVTSIDRTDRWIAVGASNGMVNVYDDTNPIVGAARLSAEPPTRQPAYVLDNLVTPISTLKFSSDGQMLLMASRAKKDALRIVHVPSFSVFRNWPTSSTPLGRVTSATFAPNSGMLTAGNEAGAVRLWSLNHYSTA